MSARTHTQRCPSRTSAPSLSPPTPDVLICSCAHPHPPHTHPPRTVSRPAVPPAISPITGRKARARPLRSPPEFASAAYTSPAPSHAITANHPRSPPEPSQHSFVSPAEVLKLIVSSFRTSVGRRAARTVGAGALRRAKFDKTKKRPSGGLFFVLSEHI